MTELSDTSRIAPGALEAWQRHLGREIDAGTLRAELVEGSLPRAFHEVAVRAPNGAAMTIDDEEITHGKLDRLAATVGGCFGRRASPRKSGSYSAAATPSTSSSPISVSSGQEA
jgi:hypothetical protein